MPAGINEGSFYFDNVEEGIDKCLDKLKDILNRWRSLYPLEELKEFEKVLEYQNTLVKLVLNSQGILCT